MSTSSKRFHRIIHNSNRRRGAAAAADVTYVKAHINRGSAGNNVLDLEFSDTVTGSDFETGITIEVTANNTVSYTTIDKSETSSIGIVSDKYIRYTFDGTVSTFQGLNVTVGHQVQVSISSSPLNVADVSAGVGNSRALENGSTVNLLDLFTHGYDMDEATGAERADAIGSLNFDDVNDVTQQDGVSTATVKSAGFTRSSSMRLTHADNAAFDNDNTEYFGWMMWVRLTAVNVTEFIICKQNSGATGADWNIMYHGDTASGNDQFKWGVCRSLAGAEQANWATRYDPALVDTWYMIAGWFDPTDVGSGSKNSYVNVTKVGDAFDAGTTDTLTITSGNLPTSSTSGIEFGSVNGGANYLDGRVDAAYWFKGASGPSNDEISDFFNGGNGKQWPFIPDS